jgi:hypothetical protein
MQTNQSLKKICLDNIEYLLGYKVVTSDMRSLGLRKNPNIIEYPVNEWFMLPQTQVKHGAGDWGGIWACRSMGGARKVSDYMREKYAIDTRIFKALLDDVLYANSYRVKTNGILLFEEITDRITKV